MSERARKLASVWLLITLLFFPLPLHAGRKHADVEDIGNRNINGKVAWILHDFMS